MFTKTIPILLMSLAVFALEDFETIRAKRSPGNDQPWELKPQVGQDQNGNTIADVNVKRKGDQHDFEAGWSKVVNGPNRAKPNWHVGGTFRWRRSAEGETVDSRVKRSPENDQPWELKPQVGRDQNGNTIADVNVKRKGDQHDFEAGWSKVVNGPNRAKPNWHVGGTFRWRRSLEDETVDSRVKRSPENDQPWELKPQVGRDQNGNTIADVNVKRKGDQNDFEAGWSKVVNGPNRAKPNWHVGGTFKWRRSLEDETVDSRVKRSPENDQPWELKPQVGRDQNGNTIADVNVKRKGDQHDFEAGWTKVVNGPNRAKPSWHVGGTFRWRRSLEDETVDSRVKRSPENDQPWELKPQVGRDQNGNTIADVNVKRKGDQHDFEAGWSKVVNGPNRAKPNWHVGGTFRWRRSAEVENVDSRVKRSPENDQPWELKPQVGRDQNGNTIADVNVKRKGDQHDFEAGWSKVVNGPNRAKPNWHVGGTFRWRRSIQPHKGNKYPWEVYSLPRNGQPTWNSGSPRRFRRSPDGDLPWELKPQVGRDENGNTIADINVNRKGDQHDFEAGWSKVVDGPNRAKPTWHVGGTFRWRRSIQPHKGNKYPWEVYSLPRNGQPTWNSGSARRFRRSLDGDLPWEFREFELNEE